LLDSYKVAIPIGEVAFNEDDAYKIAKKLKGGCVVKS
jgi:succinyl-CoA synthetase beta subunit